MAKVFITGGTGFVGYHLVKALTERGHEVVCLVRATSRTGPLEPFGVRFHPGSLHDVESLVPALTGVQIVYHLAGTTKALKVDQFFQVNERGTESLLQACRRVSPPPVVVIVSSLAAAGPVRKGREPHREGEPSYPVSWYGKSKRAGELVAEKYAGELPITIVRPPIILGEWDKDGLEMFKPIARTGVHLVPGYRRKYYSVVYAGDLAELLVTAAERAERLPKPDGSTDKGQGYYYAAFDECPSYGELGKLMGKALGRRTLVIPVAPPVVWTVALLGELTAHLRRRPVVFHLDKAREALAGSWMCSAQKAREQLGFSTPKTLLERLEQTVKWYRREKWL